MFIGHFGVGLGAKKAAPKVSLGTLFIAAQFLDLLWPTFLLLGWEHVEVQPGITKMSPLNFTDYPISHSLLMACVWGLLMAFAYYLIKKRSRGAIVLGLCVVSHWVLDLLVHKPDLPIYPGNSQLVGLGLWNHPPLEIIVEGLIFLIGIILYLRATKAKNKTGIFAFWPLVILLALIYVSQLFGSPPPGWKPIAWVGESQWLFVLWAFWADNNREPRNTKVEVTA